ncbi:MAG: hypothetical protein WCO44_08730 [Bacteroidota bacterium]
MIRSTGLLALLIVLLSGGSGCKKNSQIDLKPNLNVASDQILAIRPFTYVVRMVARAAADSVLHAAHQAVIDSAEVTLDAKNQKYTFTFLNKMCADSVIRSGVFVATVDSGFFHKGTSILLAFNVYAEDNHRVNGTDSLHCTGAVNGRYLYDNRITGVVGKDTLHNIQFNALLHLTVATGIMVQGVKQTVIATGGTTQGISSAGYSYSSTIASVLTQYESCPWISDGLLYLSIPGATVPAGTIEFLGKSVCSDRIQYSFEGNIYPERIRNKYLNF